MLKQNGAEVDVQSALASHSTHRPAVATRAEHTGSAEFLAAHCASSEQAAQAPDTHAGLLTSAQSEEAAHCGAGGGRG